MIRYLHLHANGTVVYLEEKSDSAFIGYSITHPVEVASEQVTDAAVTAIFNILRKLCGVKWQATELQFTHAQPTNTRPFVHYFKAPLRFKAGKSGVLFPADWLTRPVLGADPASTADFLASFQPYQSPWQIQAKSSDAGVHKAEGRHCQNGNDHRCGRHYGYHDQHLWLIGENLLGH